MILLYPSAESETSHSHWPWLTLLFCFAALFGSLFWFQPRQQQHQSQRDLYLGQIENILDHASRQGRLHMDHRLRAQTSLAVLADANFQDVYPESAVHAYQQLQALQPAYSQLLNQSLPARLQLLLAWPSLQWFLVVTLLLFPLAFLLEHIYSPIFLIPSFALCAIAALLGSESLLNPLWLKPQHAWLGLVLIWGWLPIFVCPWAKVELSFKFWFSKNTFLDFEMPIFFAGIGLVAWCIFSPESARLYQVNPVHLLGPIAFAALFSLPLRLVPHKQRSAKVATLKGDAAKRGLVESLFLEERHVEAESLLRELSQSAASVDDHLWIARAAWRHDLTDLAANHYRQRLNLVAENATVEQLVPLLEEMMQRNIAASPKILLEVFDDALARHKLRLAEKVLSHYRNHGKVSAGESLAATQQFAEVLMMGDNPEKASVVALKDWLEQNDPTNPLIQNIIKRFQAQTGASRLSSNYGNLRVHKHVEIDLHAITSNMIEVRIKGRQDRQRIPWTAVSALYGYCIVSHTQGLYGCLVINFRNRLFACHFGRRNVFLSSSAGKPLSFEAAWQQLMKELPEDITRVEIEAFQQFIRSEESEAAVESYLSANLNQTS